LSKGSGRTFWGGQGVLLGCFRVLQLRVVEAFDFLGDVRGEFVVSHVSSQLIPHQRDSEIKNMHLNPNIKKLLQSIKVST
jgi:hypothetical protein